MGWLIDPQIDLLTLTALEIVLGIDNLVFIAILAARLPEDRQSRARAPTQSKRCRKLCDARQHPGQQDAERERTTVMRMAPFLNAERFAGQFGTQAARDHMLRGLKKAGFTDSGGCFRTRGSS